MGTSFLRVLLVGVELDDLLKLPGGHVPCMGSFFLCVSIVGVE